MLALSLTACASAPAPATSTADDHVLADCSIAMIPKNTDNPYFAAIKYGADEAAKELKGSPVHYIGSAQADLQAQIQRVQSAATRGSCVINVSAVDTSALVPALNAAKALGSRVVSFDADVSSEARTLFINQVDSTELGVTMFKEMAQDMGFAGDYAILSAQATAANQNAWIAAMLEESKKP